jgi:Rod binding domain-containing protein
MTATSPVLNTSSVVQRDLDKLREASGQVVGSVFYGTLLKTMRESSLKGSYGHGGRGEEVFAAQLDGIMAEEMGQSRSGGLADVLFKKLEHQQTLVSELRAKR